MRNLHAWHTLGCVIHGVGNEETHDRQKIFRYTAVIPRGKNVEERMEQETRWIHYQNVYNRKGRRICHPGIQENVLCD